MRRPISSPGVSPRGDCHLQQMLTARALSLETIAPEGTFDSSMTREQVREKFIALVEASRARVHEASPQVGAAHPPLTDAEMAEVLQRLLPQG